MGSMVLRDALRAFGAELSARAAELMEVDPTLSMVAAMDAALCEVQRRVWGDAERTGEHGRSVELHRGGTGNRVDAGDHGGDQ